MGDTNRRRIALVTGGNGMIGRAICKGIADQTGHEVVLLCRDARKAEEARNEVVAQTGHDRVRYVFHVARRKSVYELADDWEGPLDVLVPNAAATPRDRRETDRRHAGLACPPRRRATNTPARISATARHAAAST